MYLWINKPKLIDLYGFEMKSKYNRIGLAKKGDKYYVIINDKVHYTITSQGIEEEEFYASIAQQIASQSDKLETVAIIGGSDGLVVKELLKYNPEAIYINTLDPLFTKFSLIIPEARFANNNSLWDKRCYFFNEPILKFIDKLKNIDVIIIDLPQYNEILENMFLYRKIKNGLQNDGILAVKVPVNTEKLVDIINAIKSAFNTTDVYTVETPSKLYSYIIAKET